TGAVVFLGSSPGATDAVEIQLEDTTAASTLVFHTSGGQTTFRSINVTGALGGLVGPTSNLVGSLTVGGSLNRLNLGYVQAGSITVGGSHGALAIVLGRALDTSISSANPISSLTAQAYLNT